jgi:hypothetical protein
MVYLFNTCRSQTEIDIVITILHIFNNKTPVQIIPAIVPFKHLVE